MRTLNRLILIATFVVSVFCSSVFALSVSVDRNTLPYGDYLTATIHVAKNSFPRNYDLSPLNNDFAILARKIVNRQNVDHGVWLPKSYMLLDLAPKHPGKISIPALKIGNKKTNPVAITVSGITKDMLDGGKLRSSFLVANVDVANPYLEQQVIYTVKLFTSSEVHDGTLQDPDVRGAVIHRLGQDRYYDVTIKGKQYRVFIRRYAIFPIKTGTLEIIPSVFTGKAGQIGRRTEMRLVAPLVSLKVRPVPGLFQNQWWVPAKQLTISESWIPAKSAFRVGDSVIRVLTVRGLGLTALQLPELYQGRLLNVHSYASPPISKSIAFGANVIGLWQQQTKLTPTQTGDLILPAVHVKWWNTTTKKVEVASIPKRTIAVKSPVIRMQRSSAALTDAFAPSRKLSGSPVQILLNISHLWFWLVFALFFAALIGSLIWAVSKKQVMQREKEFAVSEGRRRSLCLARQLVQEAALSNDARQTRNALLKWAELKWFGKVFLGLPNIVDVLDDEDLKASIADLQRVLYSEAQLKWNGVEFWNTFEDAHY